MKDEIIKLKDKNGRINDYIVLLIFKWYKTNKYYMVYTDVNNNSLNNECNIYANTFDPKNINDLGDVNSEEEWSEIENRLNYIRGKSL